MNSKHSVYSSAAKVQRNQSRKAKSETVHRTEKRLVNNEVRINALEFKIDGLLKKYQFEKQ